MKKPADNGFEAIPTLSKKRILIVEDQFIEAHDLQLILEKANYEVIGIVRSVEQALEQIEIEKPDLVFLDIMLKGTRNGIELAHFLKEKNITTIGNYIYFGLLNNKVAF